MKKLRQCDQSSSMTGREPSTTLISRTQSKSRTKTAWFRQVNPDLAGRTSCSWVLSNGGLSPALAELFFRLVSRLARCGRPFVVVLVECRLFRNLGCDEVKDFLLQWWFYTRSSHFSKSVCNIDLPERHSNADKSTEASQVHRLSASSTRLDVDNLSVCEVCLAHTDILITSPNLGCSLRYRDNIKKSDA